MLTHVLAVTALMMTGAGQTDKGFPGGVLDPAGKTAYVAGPKGIDAIDLSTGLARWSSTHAQRPLFVAGDQLFALCLGDKEMHIVGLDLTGKGECTYRSRAIPVPRWVVPSGDKEQTFSTSWRRQGKSLVVGWKAQTTTRPGKSSVGQARIDLLTGSVEEETVDSPAPPLVLPRFLERMALRWHRRLDDQWLAVTEEEVAGETRKFRLLLRQWDERTGKPGRSHVLITGARPVLLKGADGLHLWTRDAGSSAEGGSEWLVYSCLDGQLVSRVPFVAGTVQAVIVHGRAYCVVSRGGRALLDGPAQKTYQLVCAELNSEKPLWTWSLSQYALSEPFTGR